MLLICLMAFMGIAVKLVQVQIANGAEYAAMGAQQRVQPIALAADRGALFDRHGHELAMSVPSATIWANPKSVTDPSRAARQLAPLLDADESYLRDRLSSSGSFVYLKRQIDDNTAKKVKSLGINGVYELTESKRVQPNGGLASSVLGKVGVDNTGLSGIEYGYQEDLTGQPGRLIAERDRTGTEIPGGLRELTPAKQGDDLVLTLDRSMQSETERSLADQISQANAKGGMAIVMDTKTGEILALANMSEDSKTGEVKPSSTNMAATHVYEPGSVNKMITIAGALEDGTVKPESRLRVTPTIQVSDHLFKEHDWHPTESWSVTDIVANSSNVGSIMVAQDMGKKRIDHYMRAFGFGKKTAVGFPGESAGIMLPTDKWSGTSIGTIPIGQGISVTALQVAGAYNTIANGGVYVAPKLVKSRIDDDGNVHDIGSPAPRRVVSKETAQQMTGMLTEVVRVGTGQLASIDGYTVAGKTGTARKPRVGARGYEEGAYISSFAGFVPAQTPGLTVVVMLDEPTPIFGGIVAAPVFAEVAQYGLREFRIPPPGADLAPVVPKASASAVETVKETKALESAPREAEVSAKTSSSTTAPTRRRSP